MAIHSRSILNMSGFRKNTSLNTPSKEYSRERFNRNHKARTQVRRCHRVNLRRRSPSHPACLLSLRHVTAKKNLSQRLQLKMRLFYLLARAWLQHGAPRLYIAQSSNKIRLRQITGYSRFFQNTVRATNAISGETYTVIVGRDLTSLILCLPGLYLPGSCIAPPEKLVLPELRLNKAEGRSKRPCDDISMRQPPQSTRVIGRKLSDRTSELTSPY